jgi:hypothetical protein
MIAKIDGSRQLAFHIHNASSMPIYEVELPLPARAGEEAAVEFVGLVPPGQTAKRPAPTDWYRSYQEPEPSFSTVPAVGGAETSKERSPARTTLSSLRGGPSRCGPSR